MRTGFAPSLSEILAYEKLSRQQAIEKILDNSTPHTLIAALSWANQPIIPFRQIKDKSDEEKEAQRAMELRQRVDLRGW